MLFMNKMKKKYFGQNSEFETYFITNWLIISNIQGYNSDGSERKNYAFEVELQLKDIVDGSWDIKNNPQSYLVKKCRYNNNKSKSEKQQKQKWDHITQNMHRHKQKRIVFPT